MTSCCARDTARHIDAVCGRHHDIVVAIRDQYRDPNAPEILRRLSAPSSDRLDLPQEGAGRRSFVPACLALLQPFQEGCRRLAAIGRGREKQIEFRVPQRQKAFDHQRPGHRPHLVDTFATRRPRAGQNELSHQVRCFQRDILRHKSAEGKAEQIDLLEAQRADQGNRIPRHFIDGHRRRSRPTHRYPGSWSRSRDVCWRGRRQSADRNCPEPRPND